MTFMLGLLGWVLVVILAGSVLLTIYSLIREKELDKVPRVLIPGLVLLTVISFSLARSFAYRDLLLAGIELIALSGALAFLLPTGKAPLPVDKTKIQRIDERDIMFARASYQPGDGRYKDYYQRNPDKQSVDDAIRNLPGLCGVETSTYDPITAAVTQGNFHFLSDISNCVEGDAARSPVELNPGKASFTIKELAKYFGAQLVGITELKPYHLYSYRGRRTESYGAEVYTSHKFAIVFAVEMNYEMVKNAPQSPTIVESSQQYVAASIIGMQLSYFIRHLGYEARNHMDGNYLVVAPLVAVDAGLGEIGRMGLLMTEKYGPRVRLGVVTTDLPLMIDQPIDLGMDSFCLHCEKCARECPSQSIPRGGKQDISGVERWKINQETCYTYWCKIGTDCAVCVNSCPYSKPDTLIHKLVRLSLRHSELARRIFPLLDDYLYGKKPYKKIRPKWL